jgi:hypothetical protein
MADVVWLDDGNSPDIVAVEQLNTRVENNTVMGVPTKQVTLEVDADKAEDFITRILNSYQIFPGGGFNYTFYATEARVRRQDGNVTVEEGNQVIKYNGKVLIDMVYTALPGLLKTINEEVFYHEEDIEPRPESVRMDYRHLIWGTKGGSGNPTYTEHINPDAAPPKQIGGWTLVRTIKGYAAANINWADLISTTNAAAYTSPFDSIVYAIDTLLLRSLNLKRGCNDYNFTTNSMTVMVKYEYRKGGWNQFYHWVNDTDSGFYDLRYDYDKTKKVVVFDSADHTPFLFTA